MERRSFLGSLAALLCGGRLAEASSRLPDRGDVVAVGVDVCRVSVTGCFSVPKRPGTEFRKGSKVVWDPTVGFVEYVASPETDALVLGVAVADANRDSLVVEVWLNAS